MANNTQRTTSIARRLNTRLKNNPAFVELAKAVDKVMRETVTKPRDALATIRETRTHHRGDWMTLDDGRRAIINHVEILENGHVHVHVQVPSTSETYTIEADSNLQERDVLINNARYHGFNFFSDTLSTEDYARVVDYIEEFWPESGTNSYYKFLGFIKHIRLEQTVLWTTEEGSEENDDYPWLEPFDNSMTPVWKGGSDYPTSHVTLDYDATIGNRPDGDLAHLFYLLAPIHLVLERINMRINAQVNYTYIGVPDILLVNVGVMHYSDPEI